MIDTRVIVDVLAVTHQVEAAKFGRRARLGNVENKVVPHKLPAEVKGCVPEVRITAQLNREVAGLVVVPATVLDPHVICPGGVRQVDVYNSVGEQVARSSRYLELDEADFATRSDIDIDAHLGNAGLCRVVVNEQTDESVNNDVFVDRYP